ncbi:MAG: hypothetical protein M1587_04720 [Thaumarchaeota archaeon]|nr:hypothetical protein [Nitrososphaerota archaeon]
MSFEKPSTGRLGESRKVSLKIMVDKQVKDALGKIRTKKSVSNLVNGLLMITIRQFDPGPSAPLIHDLRALFKKHLLRAKLSGDGEEITCIENLESQLQPYYDLAGVPIDGAEIKFEEEINRTSTTVSFAHDYSWYSTPHMCHESPMAFYRKERSWKCSICGSRYYED